MSKTRTIITKHKTYVLPIENEGIAAEEFWPGVVLPETLRGARVYDTEDGKVVGRKSQEGDN